MVYAPFEYAPFVYAAFDQGNPAAPPGLANIAPHKTGGCAPGYQLPPLRGYQLPPLPGYQLPPLDNEHSRSGANGCALALGDENETAESVMDPDAAACAVFD